MALQKNIRQAFELRTDVDKITGYRERRSNSYDHYVVSENNCAPNLVACLAAELVYKSLEHYVSEDPGYYVALRVPAKRSMR